MLVFEQLFTFLMLLACNIHIIYNSQMSSSDGKVSFCQTRWLIMQKLIFHPKSFMTLDSMLELNHKTFYRCNHFRIVVSKSKITFKIKS